MEAVVRRLTILSAALFLALAGCSSNSGAGAATTGDRKPAGPFGGDVTSTATETATTPATATTAPTPRGARAPSPASSDSRGVAVEFKIVSKGSADVVFDNGEAGFNVRTATG